MFCVASSVVPAAMASPDNVPPWLVSVNVVPFVSVAPASVPPANSNVLSTSTVFATVRVPLEMVRGDDDCRLLIESAMTENVIVGNPEPIVTMSVEPGTTPPDQFVAVDHLL